MNELLEPAFQPVVELATGTIEYYEALARLQSDPTDQGHVALIQLAERHHFIHLLDLVILNLATEAATRAKRRIGVNLSVLTIESHFSQIIDRLDALGAIRHGLILEITETVPMHDLRKIAIFIGSAREIGCQVTLDDFGIDGSHFTPGVVRFLRPDFLKLDGSMLTRAIHSRDLRPLHRATALAESIGAEVIAEFVDSEEKIDLLTRLGVRYGQGWSLGRPTRNAFLSAAAPTPEILLH